MKRDLTIDAAKREYAAMIMNGLDGTRLKEAWKRAEKAGLERFRFSDTVVREESGLKLTEFSQRLIIAHGMMTGDTPIYWERAYFVRGLSGLWGATDIRTFKSALYRGEDTAKGFKIGGHFFIRVEFGTTNGENDGSAWFRLSWLRSDGKVIPVFGRMSESALKTWVPKREGERYIAPIIPRKYSEREVSAFEESGLIPKLPKKGGEAFDRTVRDRERYLYRIGYREALRERVTAEGDTRIETKNRVFSGVFAAVVRSLGIVDMVTVDSEESIPKIIQRVIVGETRDERIVRLLGGIDGRKRVLSVIAGLRRRGHSNAVGIAYLDLVARIEAIEAAERDRVGRELGEDFIAYAVEIRLAMQYFKTTYM